MVRVKWTKDLIRSELLSVIDILNLDRMPTRKEIITVKGDDRLTNKISKTLGYYGWADELGLKMKDNDTNKGKQAEFLAKTMLENLNFNVTKMSQNFAYDLLVESVCKIDVKFSNLYKGENGNFYSFALRKKYPTCDFYLLIAKNDELQTLCYIIPSHFCNQTQISIGEKSSQYNKYLNRFDLINDFIEFVKQIKV